MKKSNEEIEKEKCLILKVYLEKCTSPTIKIKVRSFLHDGFQKDINRKTLREKHEKGRVKESKIKA